MHTFDEVGARRAIEQLRVEKETWVRVATCLANQVRAGAAVLSVGGHVAVRRSEMEAVPSVCRVELRGARVADEPKEVNGVEVSGPEEDVIVVVVLPKEGGSNGKVLAPSAPRLVLP